MTVATTPVAGTTEMIGRDVELTRSALLYADTMEIVSPVAQMLDSVVSIFHTPQAMRDLLLEAGPEERDARLPDTEGEAEARELVAAVGSSDRDRDDEAKGGPPA